eukprot:7080157-Heterocapsa_arctica.AAC.1
MRLCIPSASAVPCTAAYSSASADDREMAACVLAHTLMMCDACHMHPPVVERLVFLSPAQS